MRVAVMSDIHGFSLALKTVLADIDADGNFDQIVVAGDLCEVGPTPAEVLELLRAKDLTVIQGNTDLDLVVGARQGGARDEEEFAIEEIGPAGIEYLSGLPFNHRITPPGGSSPDDDLLVVHANPHNLVDRLDPDASDRELKEVLADERFSAIAFGHIHICYIRKLGKQLLVDVSAVGNPKDDDLRCKYGVLEWDVTEQTWHAELRKLEYPLEATIEQIKNSRHPEPEKVIRKLVKATY